MTDSGDSQRNTIGTDDPNMASADEQAEAERKARNLVFLKTLVTGLGVLMFVCMAVIVGRIVYLLSSADEVPPDTPIALSVPAGAEVLGTSLSDQRIAVRYRQDGAVMIDVFNVANGELQRRFAISDAPR